MRFENQYCWESFDFSGSVIGLLDAFQGAKHVAFLDSSQHDLSRGRFSFIGVDPFDVLTCRGKDVLAKLREQCRAYAGLKTKASFTAPFTPLTAGIIGCLGYDYGLPLENIRAVNTDDLGLPDCFFGFYDCILTVDHFTQKLYITSTGLPETNEYLRERKAARRLQEMKKVIVPYCGAGFFQEAKTVRLPQASVLNLDCNFTQAEFIAAVRKALHYIEEGDIYQVNLSQRFRFDLNGRPFDPLIFYGMLRELSPSPFGGYIDGGDFQLMSNSPERFLHLNDRTVQTRPMKGTRPRGQDAHQDRQLRKEILASDKDRAELLMITDLLRNDLGKVCDYGSICVKEMRTLEEYEYVFQATSTIEGRLRRDKDCFDVMRACFPGGSITGCPKIRAMEIIEALEPTRRGMYTGALGYVNFSGNMDFNILIRTVLAHRGQLYFQVGAGIVADSTPENEYEETLVKAKAMKSCIEQSFMAGEIEMNADANV